MDSSEEYEEYAWLFGRTTNREERAEIERLFREAILRNNIAEVRKLLKEHVSQVYLPRQLAFAHCMCLKEIVLGSSIESIGAHAFLKCQSVQRIRIDNAAVQVYPTAFDGCTHLEEVDLPEALRGTESMYPGAHVRFAYHS